MDKAQMMQDAIFRKMTAEEKVRLTSNFSAFIKELGTLRNFHELRKIHRKTRRRLIQT